MSPKLAGPFDPRKGLFHYRLNFGLPYLLVGSVSFVIHVFRTPSSLVYVTRPSSVCSGLTSLSSLSTYL